MKKSIILLFFLSGLYSKGQNYYHVYSNPSVAVQGAVSADEMTKRIKEDAITYLKYAPIPRIAKMDFAFGADFEEFKKLSGYGVLYISSLNQDSTEYPIKQVYFKTNGLITELQKIGEIKISVADAQIAHTFGTNRIDYYYLIPYNLTMQNSELLIDWAKNRKAFLLSKYPSSEKLEFVKNDKIQPDIKTIDKKFLKEFLIREYNIGID